MPSSTHEAIVAMLRELRREIGEWLPDGIAEQLDLTRASVLDNEVPQLVPPARSCDLAIRIPLRRPRSAGQCAGLVFEIRLRRDPEKEFTWPMYWASLRAELRGPVWLVVVTTRHAIERWATRMLETALRGGPWLVLGPSTIARVVDPDVARREPERAMVSALVHAGRRDSDLVPAIAAACSTLPAKRGMLMHDVIMQRLGRAAKRALEAQMLKDYVWKSDFAIKHQAKGREEGLESGLQKGQEQGLKKGRLEVLDEIRRSLLGLIASRRIPLSDRHRRSVAACSDPTRLVAWTARVPTAERASEIFAPLPKSRTRKPRR